MLDLSGKRTRRDTVSFNVSQRVRDSSRMRAVFLADREGGPNVSWGRPSHCLCEMPLRRG